jgi:NADH-quinone oxidoreductase subunit H
VPFLHRDGLTIAFGKVEIVRSLVPHVWMTLIGVLAFFAKVVVVCLVQAFVRWSLPRFRYDQLMRLGWKILLPVSLANILITGVVWLALDQAGPAVSDALRVAADVTQAVVVVVVTYLVVRGVLGLLTPVKHQQTLLGTSADEAVKRGGTKATPMQA